MKKYIALGVGIVIATTGIVAHAETSISTNTSVEVHATGTSQKKMMEKSDKMEERKGNMMERKEAILKKLDEKGKQMVVKIILKVQNKFSEAINRLVKIDAKIETRIAKFEAKGINVIDTKALLVKARADLKIAQANLAALPTAIKTTLSAETVSKDELKTAIAKAKESIKAAHASYVQVVASLSAKDELKEMKHATSTKKIEVRATTTATTTVN